MDCETIAGEQIQGGFQKIIYIVYEPFRYRFLVELKVHSFIG